MDVVDVVDVVGAAVAVNDAIDDVCGAIVGATVITIGGWCWRDAVSDNGGYRELSIDSWRDGRSRPLP